MHLAMLEVGSEVCQDCLEFIQSMQSIHDKVKNVSSPKNIYDMEQAVAAIFEYSKHQMILSRRRQKQNA